MGNMTRGVIRTELGFLLRNRKDSDATDTSRLNRWINQAYDYMCHPSVHHFQEMEIVDHKTVMVAGTNVYDIESINNRTVVFVRHVSHVFATTWTNTARKRRLTPRSMQWFEKQTLSTGAPTSFTISGELIDSSLSFDAASTLYIAPVPRADEAGQILRIGFYQQPQSLNSDSDKTDITSYYDRVLLKFAQAFAESDLGDRARSLLTLKEASGLLNNTQEEKELEASTDGYQVPFILENPMGP